jgi:hypothetical protein
MLTPYTRERHEARLAGRPRVEPTAVDVAEYEAWLDGLASPAEPEPAGTFELAPPEPAEPPGSAPGRPRGWDFV